MTDKSSNIAIKIIAICLVLIAMFFAIFLYVAWSFSKAEECKTVAFRTGEPNPTMLTIEDVRSTWRGCEYLTMEQDEDGLPILYGKSVWRTREEILAIDEEWKRKQSK